MANLSVQWISDPLLKAGITCFYSGQNEEVFVCDGLSQVMPITTVLAPNIKIQL